MSHKGEVNIFGAAFIDLIGVALCSQLILSLADQEQEMPPPELAQEVRIFELSQHGLAHICEAKLADGMCVSHSPGNLVAFPATAIIDGSERELHFRDSTKPDDWKQITVSLDWLEPEGGYAGGLRISVIGKCKPFTICIGIGNCGSPGDVHYLRAESIVLGQPPQTQYFVCNKENELPAPNAQFKSPEIEPDDDVTKNFRSALQVVPTGKLFPEKNFFGGSLEIHVPASGPISVGIHGDAATLAKAADLTKKYQAAFPVKKR